MAETIDTLELQIQSDAGNASDGLDRLVRSLTQLHGASGSALSGMKNLSSGIQSMADSIERLANLNLKQSMGSLESQIDQYSKKMAQDLVKMFDIKDKNVLEDVKNLQKEFANLMKTENYDSDAWNDALVENMNRIASAMVQGVKETRVFDGELTRLLNTVRSIDKIKISPYDMQNLRATEDWQHKNGLLLQKMSTKEGIPLDSLMKEWMDPESLGNFYGVFQKFAQEYNLDNVQNQFLALNELIKQAQEGVSALGEDGLTKDVIKDDTLNVVSETIRKIDELREKMAGAAGGEGSAENAGFDISGLEKLIDSTSKLGNKNAAAGIENLSKMSAALSSLVSNLNSAGSLNFNTDIILALANTVAKLGQSSITDAVKNLESLKTSLAEFVSGMNGIGAVSSGTDGIAGMVNSVSRLGGKTASQAVQNLPQITASLRAFAEGMNSLGGVTFNFEGMNSLLSGISRLGGKAATQAVMNLQPLREQITQFVSGLNALGGVTFDMAGLDNLVSSISRLGGKAAGNAVPNIQSLGVAISEMMGTLAKAPAVSGDVIRMTEALANLSKSGNKTGAAVKSLQGGISGLSDAMGASKLGGSIKSLQSNLNGLSGSMNRLQLGLGKVVSGIKGFARSILSAVGIFGGIYGVIQGIRKSIDISSDLIEVQNVVDVTFGDMADKVDELAKHSIGDFGMSELTVKKMSSRFQAMGVALGFGQEKMSDMSIQLTKLAADMASFYNMEQTDVAEDLEAIFTGQTRPLRQYGIDLTQATLQEWALKNGIDANMQSMTQAEKAMLRYQYVLAQTGHVVGDFSRTQDTWANQTRILVQNLQALGSIIGKTFINALRPFVSALNSVMESVIAFAETVANALGRIFGWTIRIDSGGLANDFEAAGAGADEIADGTGKAADNAKKLNKYIAPWQEVNNMTSPDESEGSGGGGGSGGAGGGAADAAEAQLVQMETIFDKYESDIDSLYELGEYIGDTLTNALRDINWDDVYAAADDFGVGLAEFLNGLISPELFSELGTSIAGALNTALHFLDTFGETFEWYKFGESINAGIMEFFNTFDFELLEDTMRTWGEGLANFLNGLITPEMFRTVGESIGKALTSALTFLNTFGTTFEWDEFGDSIAAGINGFFDKFDFGLLAETLNTWAKGLLDAFISAVKKVEWRNIGDKIGEFLEKIEFTEIAGKIMTALWEALNAAFDLYKGLFETAPFETVILSLVGITALLKTKPVDDFFDALKRGISVAENLGGALLGQKDALDRLHTQLPKTAGLVDALRTAFSKFQFGIENGNLFTGLKEGFGSIATSIQTVIQNLSPLTKGIGGVASVIGEFLLVKDGFYDIVSGSGDVVTAFGEIVTAAGIAGTFLTTAFGPAGTVMAVVTGLAAAFLGVKEAVEEIDAQKAGEEIKEAFSNPGGTPIEDLSENFSHVVNTIGDSFSLIVEKSDGLEKADSNIKDTYLEIEKIETAMESGVMSVEEGTKKLTELFDTLATAAQEKFGILEETLLAAFGENGALRQSYDKMGIDTEELMKTTLQVNDEALKRIEEITKELSTLDPSNPNYLELKQELGELLGTTDELSQAVSDYELKIDSTNIDYSGLLDSAGNLDSSKLTSVLDTITTAMKNADSDITDGVASVKTTLEQELQAALNIGDTVSAEKFQTALNALPEAMGNLQSDIAAKGTELTDALQTEFVGKINEVVTNAQADWDNLNWGEKLIYGFDETSYIQGRISNYKTNYIDPLSQSIEENFEQLGIDGAGWSSAAADNIINEMFTVKGNRNTGQITTTLNQDWRDIIDNAMKGIPEAATSAKDEIREIFSELGYEASDEVITAFANQEPDVRQQTIDLLDKISEAEESERDELTFRLEELGYIITEDGLIVALNDMKEPVYDASFEVADQAGEAMEDQEEPLRETGEATGTAGAEGFNTGLGSQTDEIRNTSEEMKNAAKDPLTNEFSSANSGPMYDAGANASKGFMQGLKDWWDDTWLGRKIQEFKNTISGAKGLDEHSPSKVMEQFGLWAMEGFNIGLEDQMPDTYSSISDWVSQIRSMSEVEFDVPRLDLSVPDMDDYKPEISGDMGVGKFQTTMQMEMDAQMAELAFEERQRNERLDAILAAIEDKQLIVGDDAVFRANRRAQHKYYRQTNRTGLAGVD